MQVPVQANSDKAMLSSLAKSAVGPTDALRTLQEIASAKQASSSGPTDLSVSRGLSTYNGVSSAPDAAQTPAETDTTRLNAGVSRAIVSEFSEGGNPTHGNGSKAAGQQD